MRTHSHRPGYAKRGSPCLAYQLAAPDNGRARHRWGIYDPAEGRQASGPPQGDQLRSGPSRPRRRNTFVRCGLKGSTQRKGEARGPGIWSDDFKPGIATFRATPRSGTCSSSRARTSSRASTRRRRPDLRQHQGVRGDVLGHQVADHSLAAGRDPAGAGQTRPNGALPSCAAMCGRPTANGGRLSQDPNDSGPENGVGTTCA